MMISLGYQSTITSLKRNYCFAQFLDHVDASTFDSHHWGARPVWRADFVVVEKRGNMGVGKGVFVERKYGVYVFVFHWTDDVRRFNYWTKIQIILILYLYKIIKYNCVHVIMRKPYLCPSRHSGLRPHPWNNSFPEFWSVWWTCPNCATVHQD